MTVHKHTEAFHLMQYESKDGKVRRAVWNSRDGVTPFGFVDPETKVELTHDRWNEDLYLPEFEPPDDMLVWITAFPSVEDCRDMARRSIASAPQYAPPPDTPEYEIFVERLAYSLMKGVGEEGQPGLTTGLEYKTWLSEKTDDSRDRQEN